MKVIVALCLLVTSVAAVDPENLTVGDRVASVAYSYSSQFDPQSNIAPGKSLNQIPANRRQHACTLDFTRYYEHGELFRFSEDTRCITYRCEDASSQIYQEGCLDTSTQRCVYVGHTWTIRCHTFLCTKRIENGMIYYESARNNIGCYDRRTNSCRRENENFSHVDRAGNYRERCTCRILPGASQIFCW